MKRIFPVLVAGLAACGGPSPRATVDAPTPDAPSGPFSIILFIGDGAGIAAWSAAKAVGSEMGIDQFRTIGLVETESSNSRVTDSAAGATAFAAGVRTYNGAIGVGPDTQAVRTVLELAESEGMATGLVATSTVTHATPASFAAHVPSRNMHWEIARDMAHQELEVLMGGGKRFFDPASRPDSANLLGTLTRGKTYVESPEALRALDLDTVRALVGLFHAADPGPATTRQPSLAEMTSAGLRVLSRDRDGFFLMVEGSQIDWRAHENAPLRRVIAEVVDFDIAVRQGLQFQQEHPNTLILVTADHATGGLALHYDEMGVFRAHYTTEGHTGEMVPLFARGPGAEAFGGILSNDEVGRLLLEMVARGPRVSGANVRTGSDTEWTLSSPSPRR